MTIFVYKGFLPLGELRIPNLARITNKERKQGHTTRKSTEKLSLRYMEEKKQKCHEDNRARLQEQGQNKQKISNEEKDVEREYIRN